MNFNEHSNLKGKHALFSPSSYYWLQDEEEDTIKRFCSSYAAQVGTIIHELAADYIQFGVKMTKFDKKQIPLALLKNGIPPVVIDRMAIDDVFENLMNYVNDAVGFRMTPEVTLFYSEYVFGTADTIGFDERNKMLRIHDLKNGTVKAKIDQLMIYNALFFLEYGSVLRIKPDDVQQELRIYQSGEILYHNPNPDDTIMVMEQIKTRDKIIRNIV